jgi:hypothetical protein
MHKSQSLFYLTTALHVSGVIITHLQEHKTTVTSESGNRYAVLLSAAIVEELVTDLSVLWVPYAPNQFQFFHDSSRQQYGVTVTRCRSYNKCFQQMLLCIMSLFHNIFSHPTCFGPS